MALNIVDLASEIERNVAAALAEDVGAGDLTAPLTPADLNARAFVLCRKAAVLCGQPWFDACVRKLDARASIKWLAGEGEKIENGARVCEIEARARALLTAERSALNFLQLLTAV